MSNRLVLIEYHDDAGIWRPFRVETSDGRRFATFDFDWCKRDETMYYENVGSSPDQGTIHVDRLCDGGRGRIWINPDYTPVENSREREPIPDVSALGYDRVEGDPVDPFADADEGDTTYCNICDDHLPNADYVCDHVWWCGSDGWWRGATGEGAEEQPCDDEACDECAQRREKGAPKC